ncbi:hypothetical protein BaRGS_00037497, partial [Batillaria attramentaria]
SNTKAKDRHAKDKHEGEVERKEGFLAYQVLPQDVSKELLEMDIDDMQRKICEFFKLENVSTHLQDAAIADYYTSAVWWAKEQGFNEQQMSGFFTAVHTLLENLKEKQMSLVDNVKEMKLLLVGIGTEVAGDVPGGGMEFLEPAQALAVSDYIFNSLFQHYRLYEYMFSHTQDEEIIGADLEVEVAKAASLPFPPPLDEGIDAEVYEAYVKTPPPSPTPAEEPADEGPAAEIDFSSDVFNQLTPQDVRAVVESVAAEMLGGLQNEISVKLREKENAILARINKVHKVAD